MGGIGYGDFAPVTQGGRFVAVCSFVWGVLLLALLVQTVMRTAGLEKSEARVCSLLVHASLRDKVKRRAAAFIQVPLPSQIRACCLRL